MGIAAIFGLLILPSAIILIFMISYVAAQFLAGGKAFSTSFHMSEMSGILITAVIVLLYTALGGFLAASLTDMIQAFFMIFALLVLPVIAISHGGGWGEIKSILESFNPKFLNPFAFAAGGIIGFLGIGLGSPGNPHILVRYMSVKDPRSLRKSWSRADPSHRESWSFSAVSLSSVSWLPLCL